MTIASQLRKSEELFQFANNLVGALAEHYNLERTEAWAVLSPNRTVEALRKHFKKERRRNDPLRQIKNARTAFSFFTKDQRPRVHEQNPNASFGELSRLVSAEWNKLSESQRKKYKTLESDDRVRFEKEKTELMERLATEAAAAPSEPVTTPTETEESTPAPTPAKAKKSKSKATPAPSTTPAPATTEKATSRPSKGGKAKKGKGGKSSRPARQAAEVTA